MSAVFWAEHQVGGPYWTLEESEDALIERELRYPMLHDLMPVNFPGKTVLDYGCGPGHDTILFLEHGAGHVFYADVSPLAMDIIEERLKVHGFENRASSLYPYNSRLRVDHIHCAGVLHHTEEPVSILKDLRNVLKPDGEARFMVYDGDLSKHTQSHVPITLWWSHDEFQGMCRTAGFAAEYVGSYPCSAAWRPDCFAACYRCLPSR